MKESVHFPKKNQPPIEYGTVLNKISVVDPHRFQCRSGSSILGQCGFGSGDLNAKNVQNFSTKILIISIAIYLSLIHSLHEGCPSYRRSFRPFKREDPLIQNMICNFWILIRIRIPGIPTKPTKISADPCGSWSGSKTLDKISTSRVQNTCLPQAKPQESESVPLYFRQTYKSKKIYKWFFLKLKVAFPDIKIINHIKNKSFEKNGKILAKLQTTALLQQKARTYVSTVW